MDNSKTRRKFLKILSLSSVALALSCHKDLFTYKPPNFVVILMDDAGWADFKPFGNPDYPTPNVQKLAKEGCSFHNFYVPQAICSASRASLLTGCYPGRTGVFSAHGPNARGLDPKFATIAETLKPKGYKTAVFGKWHVGDQPDTRPFARGFDESCGLMYSNDMWEFHPEHPDYWSQWPLQFWENDNVTIDSVSPEVQSMLTTWYTEHAVDFINQNKENPFFLYVPHSMPHVPLYCSDKFKNKSGKGLYADVMMELDWSVGQILDALKTNNLDKNTVVIFTSDNGPWTSYGNHSGKTPYREAKATGFDGGTRSACIIKYPGKIKSNTRSEKAFCSIDLLPTICHLTRTKLPGNTIDGKNVWNLVTNKQGAKNPHEYYAFSTDKNFEAIMSSDGQWKLHLPHNYRTLIEAGKNGQAGKYEQKQIKMSLFDMKNDPYESINVIDKHPEITSKLLALAKTHKNKFYKKETVTS